MYCSADFHIHSKYSFNCSPALTIDNLGYYAERKGIEILGTGDIFHPLWKKEIQENLKNDGTGLWFSKSGKFRTKFVLSAELSCIYKRDGRTRKVHVVVMFPCWDGADMFGAFLRSSGALLESNGRPFVKKDVRVLAEELIKINSSYVMFPAHIWTPWYSALGEKSGFDSLSHCFGEYLNTISAVETGLSSDEGMNRSCSFMDAFTLLSFSDAHSLDRIGRNCSLIKSPDSFNNIQKALKNGEVVTVDTWPETGKYFYDGHRKCGIKAAPGEYEERICPVCHKPLTRGVLGRVAELADRKTGKNTEKSIKTVPLKDIISAATGKGSDTKSVLNLYDRIVDSAGSELNALLYTDIDVLMEIDENTGRRVSAVRRGDIIAVPGYDGLYGTIEWKGDVDA